MKAKLQELHTLKAIFWSIALAIFACAILYAYFVRQTIYNVASRQNIESKVSALTTHIGELEFKSISLKNEISPEYAYAMGFQEVKNEQFISRSEHTASLSMRTAR